MDGNAGTVELIFANSGKAAAVFHVYDRRHLDAPPRRYTVEAGKQLSGLWRVNYDANLYDLWVLGPNGFHRHFTGDAGQLGRLSKAQPEIQVCYEPAAGDVYLKLHNSGRENCEFQVRANAYVNTEPRRVTVGPQGEAVLNWPLKDSHGWYDVSVSAPVFPASAAVSPAGWKPAATASATRRWAAQRWASSGRRRSEWPMTKAAPFGAAFCFNVFTLLRAKA